MSQAASLAAAEGDAPRANASLIVEVTATVAARQAVDLVTLFQRLDERAQQRYRNLDITELGMDAEWQRPLAFLWPDADDLVPLGLAPGAQAPVWGDVVDAGVRLSKRAGTGVYGRDAEWTEADFVALVAQVPWLEAAHTLSAEDLARLPGPDDVPLF